MRSARLLGLAFASALVLALASACGAATAADPAGGSRLAFAEWQVREPLAKSDFLLATVGPSGEDREELSLAGNVVPNPLGGLSWSPDGSQLAFVGSRGLAESEQGKNAIYLVPATGGAPRRLAGASGGTHPVWSPDGSQIAFERIRSHFHFDPHDPFHSSRYFSSAIWLVDAAGGPARQLTGWGNGKFATPSSFSPNGELALTRERGHGPEAVLMHLDSHKASVIATAAEDPVFSPDGSRIALISYRDGISQGEGEDRTTVGELYVVDPDGGSALRLTHTRDRREESPSWDPSGQRIAFVQATAVWAVGLTGVIEEVNADGSCPTLVAGKPKTEGKYGPPLDGPGLYTPVWQPGAGREAGPISC